MGRSVVAWRTKWPMVILSALRNENRLICMVVFLILQYLLPAHSEEIPSKYFFKFISSEVFIL